MPSLCVPSPTKSTNFLQFIIPFATTRKLSEIPAFDLLLLTTLKSPDDPVSSQLARKISFCSFSNPQREYLLAAIRCGLPSVPIANLPFVPSNLVHLHQIPQHMAPWHLNEIWRNTEFINWFADKSTGIYLHSETRLWNYYALIMKHHRRFKSEGSRSSWC